MWNSLRNRLILSFLTIFLIALALLPQPSTAQEQTKTTFTDDFNSNSSAWQYMGSAYRNQTGQYMTLTDANSMQAGVAFFDAPIPGAFTAKFSYKAGGGYSGDGFTMFFYIQKYSSFSEGGNLGFNLRDAIIPGYGIAFDGWRNWAGDFQSITNGKQTSLGDPADKYIGLIQDCVSNHLVYVNDSRTSDNLWHQVAVSVDASTVKVYVDNGLVLQWSGEIDRTYDGFGFSAGNGQIGSNAHYIDNFSITSSNLQLSTLTTYCTSAASASSFNVKINGELTFNSNPIPNAPILLSYSITGGDSWQDLTMVHTDSEGDYSALWLLSVTGDYMIKAVYKGNENYLGTNDIVNFSLTPCEAESVFSVTSNSTLSQLSFDSNNKQLTFTVSGQQGTTGYIDVYIPKTLLNQTSDLKVYLDSNQIQYNISPLTDGWLLHASYHHSSHTVTVSLAQSNLSSKNGSGTTTIPTKPEQGLDWIKISIIAVMSIIAAATILSAVLFLMKNGKNSSVVN
jgi:hypothetical protein